MKQRKYTPDFIQRLHVEEVFVFGSNLNGNHAGGAARQAFERWNAKWGVGEGPTGQCYALPTLDQDMRKVSPTALRRSFERLWETAWNNPRRIFLVTKVGCGIAGWTIEEVKNILWAAVGEQGLPPNVVLPKEFAKEEIKNGRGRRRKETSSPIVDCQECEWVTRSLGKFYCIRRNNAELVKTRLKRRCSSFRQSVPSYPEENGNTITESMEE